MQQSYRDQRSSLLTPTLPPQEGNTMSIGYRLIQWNRNKYIYDIILLIGISGYIFSFMQLAPLWLDFERTINSNILGMRAFGSCAFLMLTIILCIGPLARLDSRFLPFLYNRRHFGVMFFVVAAIHLKYVLDWYHSFSPVHPFISLLSSNTNYTSVLGFPFEILGLGALVIFFVMAATSHDFWLSFLTPQIWKGIHMSIYVGYGLVVMHVTLGMIQTEQTSAYAIIVLLSLITVVGLHLAAGFKEWRKDTHSASLTSGHTALDRSPDLSNDEIPWMLACHVNDLVPDKGFVVPTIDGERIAIFRYDNKISAVSNVCAHQNGPIGEGWIIDGCITCPWHGFQYRPEDGCALPPFTEKMPTYRLHLQGEQIFVDPRPFSPGTYVEPISLDDHS